MKRILSLVMALLLTFALLAGCGDSEDSASGGQDANVDADGFSTAKVNYIAEDGASVYRIIRPDGNTAMSAQAAIVFKNMKDGLGVNIKNVLDSEDGTDMYEILVGSTNRAESQQAIDYLYNSGKGRYGDYIICTIGKKIVINGVTEDAVANAVDYFIKNFIKKEGIDGGIKYVYETEGNFSDITVNGVGIQKFTVIRDKSSRSWLVQEEFRKLQDTVSEKTGYYLPLQNDKDTAEAEYEIHIGNTVRTAKPQSNYTYEDWEIAIADKKVYLAGGSTYAVQVAITEFGKMLETGAVTNANSTAGDYHTTVAGYDSSSYYTLKWQEEFDYEAMSPEASGWSVDPISVNNQTVTNDAGETFRRFGTSFMVTDADTSMVTNGNYIMRAIKMEDATITYDSSQGGGSDGLLYKHQGGYHSGSLMRFNFGYLEMRARIPDGKGVFSSFWLGCNNGLEIDIFESLGNAHTLIANIHYWGAHIVRPEEDKDGDNHTSLDGVVTDRKYILPDSEGTLFDDYHTIGLYWNGDGIRFYCDGVMYYEDVVDERHIGQMAEIIGGFNVGWHGRTPPSDEVAFPLEYHADYFRLYQIDGQIVDIKK